MEDMKNLKELSYQELKDLATEHGLEFKGNISKADLIILLEVPEPIVEEVEPIVEEVEPAEVEEVEPVVEVEDEPIIEEEPELAPVVKGENLTEEEIVNAENTLLTIVLDGSDIELLLTALKEYSNFLKESQRKTNQRVINQEFSDKINVKVKRADELRFLIKKEVLIIDKDAEIYTIEDDGEVIGIETFEATEDGRVIRVSKQMTIGNTPKEKFPKQKRVRTSVQSVSEEL